MRYKFSLLQGYCWHDLTHKWKCFWGMWGFRRTMQFILLDTWRDVKEALYKALGGK